jgi:hypothetical protein
MALHLNQRGRRTVLFAMRMMQLKKAAPGRVKNPQKDDPEQDDAVLRP